VPASRLLLFAAAAWLGVALPAGSGEKAITPEERAHWAFRRPTAAAPPAVRDAGWVRNPIDAFVLSALESSGLAPAPEADRPTVLRRLAFDLTGLPPAPAEVERFLADRRPGAYERLVDRLLASPHYGERQAQHWLDLARYADSDGFEFDALRPDAWRYRDWVVGAINADLPYDRFVALQLAGDEVAPGDPEAFVATGFNRCYPDMVDLNDQGLRRQNALNDMTDTTGYAFLGLTIACARCHDHKFDPVRIEDYYALQAVFAPSRFRDDFPLPGGRDPRRPALARGLDETSPRAPATHVLIRGQYGVPGAVVAPAAPAVLDGGAGLRIEPTASSTGRRRALAAWLVDPGNPLTARVQVNRLWQRRFGRGLVDTPSDFGTMGDEPSHPELLDWLATELMRRGWSSKAIDRLIVTSASYRQSSRAGAAARVLDPENRLLSHQGRRRLDGEAIRDAMLAVSGRLNPAPGGPPVCPPLPAELGAKGIKAWPVSPDPADHVRRSLYVLVRRNLRYPFFEAFDRPDTNASCPRREATIIAPQALSLLNGELAFASARALARRSAAEAGPGATTAERIDAIHLLALGRRPDPEGRRLAADFVAGGGEAAWDALALALLNINEFITVD
jgi:hypothetical protein